MMFRSLLSVAGMAIAALVLGAAAHAAPIQVKYQGFANGSQTGDIRGVRDVRVRAGEFSFATGTYFDETLNAFCIDVTTNLVTQQSTVVTYQQVDAASHFADPQFDASTFGLIGNLFNAHYEGISNSVQSAAFQLALWELVYDAPVLDLSNPDSAFYVASGFGGARDLAQQWLDGLAGWQGEQLYQLHVLRDADPVSQALIHATRVPVPEPGTLALMALGLVSLGWARRRQR